MASPAGREPDRGTEYELKSKNRLEAVAVPSTLRQHTPSAHCTSPRRSSALRRQGKIAAKMDAHVGYAGGTKKDPTYYSLGDHTESVQVDFDPSRISYRNLLEVFWATPNSCERPGNRQYMSAVFYHNEEQKQLALETRDREAARRQRQPATQILPATTFYLAEHYHQKYLLQQRSDLMREFRVMYPGPEDFVAST